MGRPPSHPADRFLFGAFVAVALAFVATNVYGYSALARIDSASDDIAFNSAPSVAHLAALRTAVRHVQLLLERGARTAAAREEIERALGEVNAEARAYLSLPTFPGEKALSGALDGASERFNRAVHRLLAQAEAGALALGPGALHEVGASASQLDDAVSRAIELNARIGRDQAVRIKAVRRHAAWAGNSLTALCLALAVVAGLLVRRQVRRHAALLDEQAALQDLRARELETFAGRAAHDILNPVSASQLALQLAAKRPLPDERARELLDRALKNLARTRTIVDGLLQFARAGAAPTPGVYADLAAVVEDVVAGLRPAAEQAGIELSTEPLPPCTTACSAGVLTSLVSNLVQNALKYMGDPPTRRIVVRGTDQGSTVRLEVEDTGPGIPPHALRDVFLPYVRGATGGQDGLGLGLATVRRLAEAHGGSAGVRSVLGDGSVFWFELPKSDLGPAAPIARPPRRTSTPGA